MPFAPLNYRLADQQLRTILAQLSPCTLAVDSAMAARAAALDRADVDVIGADELLAPVPVAVPELRRLPAPPDPESPAVLLMTSGTSGPPKAAVLRHRHLAAYIIATVEFFAADGAEALLISCRRITSPASTRSSLPSTRGGGIMQLPEFFAPGWVDLAAAERVTHAMVVPTMLGRILDVLAERGQKLPSLRHLSYGGGRMPLELVERALRLHAVTSTLSTPTG